MEVVAGHQRRHGRQGADVLGRAVAGQVEQAFAHLQLGQVGQARAVGGAAPQAYQVQFGLGGQALYHGVLRRAEEEAGLQLAIDQGAGRPAAADGLPLRRVAFRGDLVGPEYRVADRAGAAVRCTDGHPQRQQVGHAVDCQVLAFEQPDRLLEHHAEAVQVAALVVAQGEFLAALHQGDLRLAGLQLGQVVQGTAAAHQLQLEALLGQLGLELLAEGAVAAGGAAGSQAGVHGRRRGDEVEEGADQRGHHRNQPEVGQEHDLDVAEDALHEIPYLHLVGARIAARRLPGFPGNDRVAGISVPPQ
ncbi:hypothetical protein FQZ97_526100 [compost metagenome]